MKSTTPQSVPALHSALRRLAAARPVRFALACALGLLAANPAPAATDTIYANDFEAYTTVATSLADTADADPTGVEWVMTDDAPTGGTAETGIQVANWLSNAGAKSLLVRPATEARIHFNNAKTGSRYTLDFWLYSNRGPTSSHNFYLILLGMGSDNNGADFVAYRGGRATNDTALVCYDGVKTTPGWVNVGVTHATGAWQHHRIVVDPNVPSLSVYVDDMVTPKLVNSGTARSETPAPTALRIVNEGNSADDGYFAIDDLSLTVDDSISLAATYVDGFEGYTARADAADDADPKGAWITTETDGTAAAGGRPLAPARVQVVNASVVAPHSGTNCLKLEGGQRAGVTLAWGTPPQADVQITWWARVPASVDGTVATYLRMSLYGAEGGNTYSGDSALLGYGSRDATIGDDTSVTYFTTAWVDTLIDYTPDVWEEYQLTTHNAQGRYTIIKNPSSASPQVVVDRAGFIGSAASWGPSFMVAWSSSNGSGHPPVYVDDIQVRSLVSIPDPLGNPYTVATLGTRFTNHTILNLVAPVGRPVVDPRDNTILFAVDSTPGGIYRTMKLASGNWGVDPQPIVGNLDRPSGLAVEANGTIWWSHDYNNDLTRSVARLTAPWAASVVETVIADFGDTNAVNRDDDAIDLTVAPASFNGFLGQPGMIVVADRGNDGDNFNAVHLINPATTSLDQVGYANYLLNPTASPGSVGGNFNAITPLPATGEVLLVSDDGFLVAVDGNGSLRYLYPGTLWMTPPAPSAAAIAADPVSGRVWVADDVLDEIWSVDPGTGADQKEIGFPLTNPLRTERQIDVHDPGMAFAPDGSFLVVSDTSTANGGGRLIIFHNEPTVIPSFKLTSVARTGQQVLLKWDSAGSANYTVQRSTDLANPGSFQSIATNLPMSTLQFTDTNAVSAQSFYRVVANPPVTY
jgi:hypothetical protein